MSANNKNDKPIWERLKEGLINFYFPVPESKNDQHKYKQSIKVMISNTLTLLVVSMVIYYISLSIPLASILIMGIIILSVGLLLFVWYGKMLLGKKKIFPTYQWIIPVFLGINFLFILFLGIQLL